MILFQLLTLEIPYPEIEQSWKISESVLNGRPPQFPPLGEEFLSLRQFFHKCTQFSPIERIRPSLLCKELSKLILQMKPEG